MKRWQVVYLLPLEVWVEIFDFPWISRQDFGLLVDKIGNFKFAEHAQFFLHEWGKQKLGDLRFAKEGLYKYVHYKPYLVDYSRTPLPNNIKSFDNIKIRHFDAETMDFFDKIRPLLTDLEISICFLTSYSLENLTTVLTNLVPMLDGIRSLYCCDVSALPVMNELFFRENEKLAKLKKLDILFAHNTAFSKHQENIPFIMNWLAQPDADGPKYLAMTIGFTSKFLRLHNLRSLDAAAQIDEPPQPTTDAKQNEQQQPCSSKDA